MDGFNLVPMWDITGGGGADILLRGLHARDALPTHSSHSPVPRALVSGNQNPEDRYFSELVLFPRYLETVVGRLQCTVR
jgi:hypothetical protein